MIAVDTSALLAIVLGEPEGRIFGPLLLLHDCVVGAPTALEAHVALRRIRREELHQTLDLLLASRTFSIVPFSADHLRVARSAYATYGRGTKHPASLNFGDCMSYAVACLAEAPLLYKGEHFILTDITPAIPA